jgi:hypothetical protein
MCASSRLSSRARYSESIVGSDASARVSRAKLSPAAAAASAAASAAAVAESGACGDADGGRVSKKAGDAVPRPPEDEKADEEFEGGPKASSASSSSSP